MKRDWIYKIILLFLSITISLLVVEFVFRFMLFKSGNAFQKLKDPSAYAVYIKEESEDFYNDDYWKLNFLFNVNRNNKLPPNPVLGWTGQFYWDTLKHYNADHIGARRPVLLYGDSFAQCVDSVRCFEDFLNSDEAFSNDYYMLNYGVGGYGVDQIYLLLDKTMDKYENPVIIFSLLTTDMDRCMLTFRDSQKPYFKMNNDDLVLEGTPIERSTINYVKKNPPEITSYLYNRYRNGILYPFRQSEKAKTQHIEEVKKLNRAILQKTFTRLKKSGNDFLILIFQPIDHSADSWRMNFLTEICEEYEVPYIRDIDIRNADSSFSPYGIFRYSITNDGHPTSYMNSLIADELKRFVLDNNFRQQIIAGTYHWEKAWVKDLEYYKKAIVNNQEWYNSVKLKATERGISVDSMITIDALYVLEREGKGIIPKDAVKDAEYFKQAILSSPEWYADIKKKAETQGIHVDSMVMKDARYLAKIERRKEFFRHLFKRQ